MTHAGTRAPLRHPALLLNRYHLYVAWFAATAAIQMGWAVCVLYVSTRRPDIVPYSGMVTFQPGIVYAAYSGMQSFFLGAAIFLCWFLNSRGWLRAAAFASMIPGLGILFGAVQILPGLLIFRALRAQPWIHFFAWRERQLTGNSLTS